MKSGDCDDGGCGGWKWTWWGWWKVGEVVEGVVCGGERWGENEGKVNT